MTIIRYFLLGIILSTFVPFIKTNDVFEDLTVISHFIDVETLYMRLQKKGEYVSAANQVFKKEIRYAFNHFYLAIFKKLLKQNNHQISLYYRQKKQIFRLDYSIFIVVI